MKKLLTFILAAILLTAALSPAFALENPVVEVTDDDAFETVLGIEFDADDLTKKPQMAIIDNKIGEVTFELENVNGEMVPWVIRFTKDAETAKDVQLFSGIYDEAMTEPITITQQVVEDGRTYDIDFNCVYAETENCTIYTWQVGKVYYSMAAMGTVSQMQLAALLDQVAEESIDD